MWMAFVMFMAIVEPVGHGPLHYVGTYRTEEICRAEMVNDMYAYRAYLVHKGWDETELTVVGTCVPLPGEDH